MSRVLPYLLLTLLVFGPSGHARSATNDGDLKFAVMILSHETCTFCPGGDSGIDRWTAIREPYKGDEVFTAGARRNAYMAGFVAAAKEYRNVQLVGLESPAGVFGGSSASWMTEEAFDHFVGRAIADLREALPVDGVYLALHGALAVRNIPRPEAELAKRIRDVVGPDVPIVASFDFHGNEDGEFLRWADMTFVTKRYPHYDAAKQGFRSARALIRLARGDYQPVAATKKVPILTPTVLQWTGKSPGMEIMERARRWEDQFPDVFVNVFLGFPWADVPDVGATVQVISNGSEFYTNLVAEDMASYLWQRRADFFEEEFLQPQEAVSRVASLAPEEKPAVLADYSDRSGDATHVLREVVEAEVANVLVATIRDERVIAALVANGAKAGDSFDMEVGGFAGPASGEPVRIRGTLRYLGAGLDFERLAIVDFGEGSSVIITPALSQVIWHGEFDFGGIVPDEYAAFVLKSRVHFRRGFDQTGYAKTILLVDAPGPFLGTIHLDALEYQNVDLADYYPYSEPTPATRD